MRGAAGYSDDRRHLADPDRRLTHLELAGTPTDPRPPTLFTRLLHRGHRGLTADADDDLMLAAPRRLAVLVACLATLALAGTASAGLRDLTIDRGIVQSISASQIILRELDGSSVALVVDGTTSVLLNGSPAQLNDVRPGFVAAVGHDGARPARFVRAFGRVATSVERGVIASVSLRQFVLRRADGSLLTLRVTPSTRVRLNGLPATPTAIRPGQLARVTYTADGKAKLVQLVGRRRP